MAAYSYNPYQFNNRPGGHNPEQDQVALFIDWDNLVISNYADRGGSRPDLEVLVRRAQQYGTVVIARAYAEWNLTADRLEVYKAGIEPIYAPVFHADRDLSGQTSRGKSLADPVMVTDCIDFLHLLPQIGTYVLVTGDKDMVPVVRLARLRGRRVVIIGPDYVANVLQQVSDEFIPYRFLLAQVVPTDPYAAFYQQQGYTYPPGTPPPTQPGYYPPQVGQPNAATPTTPPPPATDRRGRRLSSGRRGQQGNYNQPTAQPYSRIIAPPPGTGPAQMPPPYGYYGQPPATTPPTGGYQPPAAYQPAQPPQGYPVGAQPGYPANPAQSPTSVPGPVAQPTPQGYPTPAQPQNYAPPAQGYGTPTQPPQGYPVAPVQPPQGYPVAPTQPAQGYPVAPVQPSYQPSTPTPSVSPVSVASEAAIPAPPAPTSAGSVSKGGASDFNDVKEVIRQIVTQRASAGRGQMRARDLKEELLRKIPNFSERRYGFSKFKSLLNAAEIAGVLQIDQSGHILWVSAPGTPKMQFGAPGLSTEAATAAPDLDIDEDSDEDSESESPGVQAELDDTLATAPAEALITQEQVTVEPQEAETVEEAPAPEPSQTATESAAYLPEERTTSLVDAPIGAHRAREREQVAPPISERASAEERPALLQQPHYEEVIVLIDSLRNRNRWLGYELLLSNVRDLLNRSMPESEAKIQAGAILSKLLNDGIIKMAVEVHSRGARKMTVKVAHLQDDNAVVRYAIESYKAQQAATTALEPQPEVADQEAEAAVEAPSQEASLVEAPTPEIQAEVSNALQEVEWRLTPVPEEAEVAPFIEAHSERTPTQEAASPDEVSFEMGREPELTDGLGRWGSHYTRQVQPEMLAQLSQNFSNTQPSQGATAVEEAPVVESAAEAGELGQEAAPVLSEGQAESQPEFSTQVESPPEASFERYTQPHISGEEVEVLLEEMPGAEGHTGQTVHGEPDYAPPGEEPASAGGFKNTVEMTEAASTDANGYQDQFELDGKQPPVETLQPVAELDSEEAEPEEVEPEEVEESEGSEAAPKAVVRRPRRRRTPARPVAPEGEGGPGESMGQPAERRTRLHHHYRPHR